jgi:hypothetical protein
MARKMQQCGLLPTRKCVEVVAESLVAGYVGQTQEKVQKIIDSALGGVLFIGKF